MHYGAYLSFFIHKLKHYSKLNRVLFLEIAKFSILEYTNKNPTGLQGGVG